MKLAHTALLIVILLFVIALWARDLDRERQLRAINVSVNLLVQSSTLQLQLEFNRLDREQEKAIRFFERGEFNGAY